MVADKWGLSRAQLDEYSVRSHERAAAATDSGALAGQLAPLAELQVDEGVRRGSTVEVLGVLKPALREDGRMTAGNSSQISDGAAALLITASQTALAHGMTTLVRVHTVALAAEDPVIMLTAPIAATYKALAKAGLSVSDIGAFEVNEAFASVTLAWQAELGASDDVLNPLGGAIAIGHPLGGSGGVLMTATRPPHEGQRHPLRTADDVRSRRTGERHHPRTPLTRARVRPAARGRGPRQRPSQRG